ncbi:MAG: hypothetical protein OXC53_02970 [Rhodobacteraceae bacterium]|nr:hypothetical protein [Paracoccaceae bacterium]
MMGLLKYVHSQITDGCAVSGTLNKNGCSAIMTGVPRSKLVIDFDKPDSPLPPPAQRCDYLLIVECGHTDNVVAAIEMKRGNLDASKVAGQLKAGAKAAERLVPANYEIKFQPIAVCGNDTIYQREQLKKQKNKVEFRGRMNAVQLMRCGDHLKKVL